MKLGLILECPKGGTDQQVYEYVIRQWCPGLDFITLPAGSNKPQMIQNCGKVARLLLDLERCDNVLIIWDLMPPWGGQPCRLEDVTIILKKMESEQVDLTKIKLICMEPELEGWLLVEGKALTDYNAQLCHPHRVEKFTGKKLRSNSNEAKKVISKYLGHKYNDVAEALRIIQHIDSYDKIAKKHPSFARLKTFIGKIC